MYIYLLNEDVMKGLETAFTNKEYCVSKDRMDILNFSRAIFDLINIRDGRPPTFILL